MKERDEEGRRPTYPAGRQPYDGLNGVRIGALTGAIAGGGTAAAVGGAVFASVVGAGIVGAVLGYVWVRRTGP